jgi:PAS domain S-box-containing protein
MPIAKRSEMNIERDTSETHLTSTAILVVFLMMFIFVAEVTVMELLAFVTSLRGTVASSFADAVILSLLYAPPLWFFIIRPLYGNHALADAGSPVKPKRMFVQVMSAIFGVQFLIDLGFVKLMPGINGQMRLFSDAGLTVLLMAPFLWWIVFRPALRRNRASLADTLGIPVKLNILILSVVFLIHLLEDTFLPYLILEDDVFSHMIVDSFVTALIVAPFIWRIVAKPLNVAARNEKRLADAVRNQVVDAILTVDRTGIIESVNPAAERIFGYAKVEVAGEPAQHFFCDQLQCNATLRRVIEEAIAGRVFEQSFEIACRHRNGSLLVADMSLSRVVFEDYEQMLVIVRDISGRKHMENELLETKQRYELAVSGSHDGIWDWDIRTGMVYYSPRLMEMLGYGVDELESNYERFLSLLHHNDRDAVAGAIRRHVEKHVPFDAEFRMRIGGGGYRWFRARGQAVWNDAGRAERMAGSISDITVQREKDSALRESELRFRQIFEQSEDAIIFFKPGTCVVIDANNTAEKLFGFCKAELHESGVDNFCRQDELQRLSGLISMASTRGQSNLDRILNRRKDGTEIMVSVRCKVITIQGVDITYCTFRDITDRTRLEEESRNIQAKLIQANKMTSLGLLVSGVAHEINNPNNFIMANSQLLSKVWQDSLKILREYHRENGEFQLGGIPFSVVDDESAQLFAGITEGSRRINGIVNNLKDFARKDRSAANREVNINQVVTTALTILHHQIVRHTEMLHIDLAGDIPPVRGSIQQLEQVVINLVMNACQALPNTQCGIWVATGHDEQTGHVFISVRDEGVGIPANVRSQVLEPFFTTKLDSGGTGLGLSISHSIIKEHEGTLEFRSEPGKGTTVIVRIPAGRPVVEEQSA